MSIGSVMYEGVAGYRNAQQSIDRSAQRIARQPIEDSAQASAVSGISQPREVAGVVEVAQPNVRSESLEDALLNLNIQTYYADASAKVIKTADQLIGTLINTRA